MKWRKIFIGITLAMMLGGCNIASKTTELKVETEAVQVDSESKALSLVLEYLKDHEEYIPAYVEVESETDSTYTVHLYDLVINPATRQKSTSTVGRYDVNKTTGEVTKQ